MMTQIRNPQSPQYEAPFPSITSPLRGLGSSIQSSSSTPSDVRASLQRRFTTNVLPTAVGTLSAIGQQRRQAAESMDSTFWVRDCYCRRMHAPSPRIPQSLQILARLHGRTLLPISCFSLKQLEYNLTVGFFLLLTLLHIYALLLYPHQFAVANDRFPAQTNQRIPLVRVVLQGPYSQGYTKQSNCFRSSVTCSYTTPIQYSVIIAASARHMMCALLFLCEVYLHLSAAATFNLVPNLRSSLFVPFFCLCCVQRTFRLSLLSTFCLRWNVDCILISCSRHLSLILPSLHSCHNPAR